ncbi:hypothetical protein LCGC14_0831150, partial [marine sediment metagenome]
LGALKTRLRNQIADLETQIESGERIVKARTELMPDEEVAELRQRRDVLKQQFDEIFGQKELTDAQRVRNATAVVKRSIAEYERRIVEKDLTPKRRVSKTPDTPELQALRARRDALRDEYQHLQDLANPKMTPEERADSAYKANLTRRAAEYRERLANRDFVTRKRKIRELSPEAEKARFEFEEAKLAWLREKVAEERTNRTVAQKIFGAAGEGINLSRAMVTSIDFSAMLRQGGIVVFAHPVVGAKAVPDMLRSFRSKAGASAVMNEITNRPNFAWYQRAGLWLADIQGTLRQQEEEYAGRWIGWVSRLPPGPRHLLRAVAASGRAHVAFLNRLRADMFDALAASLGRGGTVSELEAKAIARFVNVATGRGSLGELKLAAETLSKLFFAPRFVASRFQWIAGQPLYGALAKDELGRPIRPNRRTQMLLAKEYARTFTGIGLFMSSVIMALYAAIGLPGEEEEWDIETSPISSDFLKIRIGTRRIDPFWGVQQVVVFFARQVTGKVKTTYGDVVSLEEGAFGRNTRFDVLVNFGRSKLSPAAGAAMNILDRKNIVGERTTALTVSRDVTIPLAVRDIPKAMNELGVPLGMAWGLIEMAGMSTQDFARDVDPEKLPGRIKTLAGKPSEKTGTEADYQRRMTIFVRRSPGLTLSQAEAALKERYKIKAAVRNGKRTAYGSARNRLRRRWPKGKTK